MSGFLRSAAGALFLASGRASRNRRAYGPGPGLRIVALHAEDTDDFDTFRRLVDWFGSRLPIADPSCLDDGATPLQRDELLLTFDDGHARTFRAMEWLAKAGIRVVYFVIPSYLNRSVREFLAHHASRGVTAYNIAGPHDLDKTHGLESGQLRELEAMGHRIGAHNDAHRDLAVLDADGIAYEVSGGVDLLERYLDHRVDDFAWAFGWIDAVTPASLDAMRARCRRVFSSVRGWNVPGVTPAVFLRDPLSVDEPALFREACLRGAVDHRYAAARARLMQMTGRRWDLA